MRSLGLSMGCLLFALAFALDAQRSVGEERHKSTILRGHIGVVGCVAFSPDGKLVASGSADQTIKLWDVATGQLQRTLKGHHSTVNAVAFSPDGTLVASGSEDRTVRLWDVATGQLRRTLAREDIGPVRCVAFSPDGKTVASANYEPTIRLWDVASGELQRTLFEPSNGMWSVAFAPDGQIVWSASAGGWVTAWDVKTGKAKRQFGGGEGPAGNYQTIVLSPDGKLLASGKGLWDTQTGRPLRKFVASAVACSPDGNLLARAGREIGLWEVSAWSLTRQLKGHERKVKAVAFSPDGKLLASGSEDRTVRLWEITTGR